MEYREIKINEIGTSSYTMSPKHLIQRTNAIGLISSNEKKDKNLVDKNDVKFIKIKLKNYSNLI